ncbi:MAG: DUF3298 domain-containing protein [Lentisphaeria bacterium]|nr:DUF3298 domain-containing protein [Lentisphaeria bacterium]MBQ7396938.1 DUF3298 domain-containing protein [Lentisphaeria bacterium]
MKNFIVCCFTAVSLVALCGCVNSAEQPQDIAQEFISTVMDWENPAELADVPSMRWQSKCDCKIISSNERFVSFKIVSQSYTGGAHGMTHTKVGTVKNRKIMTLADLPEDIRPLWERAAAKYYKVENLSLYLKSEPAFVPYITENFYLDDKGIHFIYDPYEIDCYAAGTVDIFVPYNTKGL